MVQLAIGLFGLQSSISPWTSLSARQFSSAGVGMKHNRSADDVDDMHTATNLRVLIIAAQTNAKSFKKPVVTLRVIC